MPPVKNRWGVVLFFLSIPFIAIAFYSARFFPLSNNLFFYRSLLPYIGFFISIMVFITGHFSYPRVHNFKVYLLGYAAALVGIGYFGFYTLPLYLKLLPADAEYFKAILLLTMINCSIIAAVPSFIKYRTARGITMSLIGAETVLVVIFRFAPESINWISVFHFHGYTNISFWIGPFWAWAILGYSLWKINNDFYFGGVIAGCAFCYAILWCTGVPRANVALQQLLLAATSLYLCMGIIVHWFTRMDHRIAYDPLLHIYNRDYCSKIIAEQANLNVSPPFTVAMIDIDHFKNVNDTHGHQAGDAVLYAVAQAVYRGILPHGIVCRYGGEELSAFFPQKTAKDIAPLMNKIRIDIGKMKTSFAKKQISVTISCGVAHRDNNSQSIMDVINAADKALYRAKKGGRNQVCAGKTPGKEDQ
jgi:diguanylate cyclase (GGDEF)-like protein